MWYVDASELPRSLTNANILYDKYIRMFPQSIKKMYISPVPATSCGSCGGSVSITEPAAVKYIHVRAAKTIPKLKMGF
jgi:hypothetical protein